MSSKELKQSLINSYEEFVEFFKNKNYEQCVVAIQQLEKEVFHVYPYICSEEIHSIQLYEYMFNKLKTLLRMEERIKVNLLLKNHIVPLLKDLLRSEVRLVNKKVIVGVYDAKTSPLKTYKDRIPSLELEAQRQGAELFYFTDKDILLSQKKITATYLNGDEQKKKTIDYPDVVYNIWADRFIEQSKTQYELRKEIPFLCHSFGDKIEVPQKLLRIPELATLIIPFVGVTSIEKVENFLKENKKGVLKPYKAARGEDIFFIEKLSKNSYLLNHHGEEITLTKEVFLTWVEEALIPRGYILQKYIRCETKDNKPFDMRVLMQKNGCGQWNTRLIYPRVGKGDSIVSTTNEKEKWDIFELLEYEYGAQALDIYKYIERLSHQIAKAIDNEYGGAIEEQGLDIAIDNDGDIWMYESNNKPGTFGVAIKSRAMLIIAYAKYLAANQIFPTNQYQEPVGLNIENIQAPRWKGTNKIIGSLGEDMSVRNPTNLKSFALLAKDQGFTPVVFTFKDIDLVHQKILGYTYEEHQWRQYIFPYPDAYVDEVNLRSEKSIFNVFYEHLPKVVSNTFTYEKLKYEVLYPKLKEALIPNIIDQTIATDFEIVKKYLDKYQAIYLEPHLKNSVSPHIYIEKTSKRKYTVIEDGMLQKNITLKEIESLFHVRTEFDLYRVREYVASYTPEQKPFDFRLHCLRKSKQEQWEIVKAYPRISTDNIRFLDVSQGAYTTDFSYFVQVNYPKNLNFGDQLQNITEEILEKLTSVFQEEDFSEVTVGIVYDPIQEIFKLNYFNPLDSEWEGDSFKRIEYSIHYIKNLLE